MRARLVLATFATLACGHEPEGACRFTISVGACGGAAPQQSELCVAADDEEQCQSFAAMLQATTCTPSPDSKTSFEGGATCDQSCSSDAECGAQQCCLAAPMGQCVSLETCESICPQGSHIEGDPPVCTCDEGLTWNADSGTCV